MSDDLTLGHKDLERHAGALGMGGDGRSTSVEAGNAAVEALKAALTKANVPEGLRAPIIGHFCNEWNSGVELGTILL